MLRAAGQEVVPADLGSGHYSAVARHLEVGGGFFAFADVEGDLERLADLGDRLLDAARKSGVEGIPQGLKARTLLDALGLSGIRAVGMSSRKLPGNRHHNRALVYIPEGRRGLLKVLGGAPAPLAGPVLAPADSDLVMEQELHLSRLVETADAVLDAAGSGDLKAAMHGLLQIPVPALGMTAAELIGRLDTRIVVVARLEPGRTLKVPAGEMSIPAVQALISLDQLGFLFEAAARMLAESDRVEIERGDGFELIRPTRSLPGDMDYFRPVLFHDRKTGRILAATHQSLVEECLAGASPLRNDPAFAAAAEGVPLEANAFSYATPRLINAIVEYARKATGEGEERAGDANAYVDAVLDWLSESGGIPTAAEVSAQANLPEGILSVSNSTTSFKDVIVQAAAAPALLIAGAASGYAKITQRIQEREMAPGEEEEPGGNEEPFDEAGTRAVRSNLQQIVFSAQSYFLDNPSVSEVTYQELLDAQLLFEVQPQLGEDYTKIRLRRSGGRLTVETDLGPISLEYPPATD